MLSTAGYADFRPEMGYELGAPVQHRFSPYTFNGGWGGQTGGGAGWGTLFPQEGALRRAAVGLGLPRLALASPRLSVKVCLPLRAPFCRKRRTVRGRAGLGLALGWASRGCLQLFGVVVCVRVGFGTLGLPEFLRIKISTFRAPQNGLFIVAQKTHVMVVLPAFKPVTGLKATLSWLLKVDGVLQTPALSWWQDLARIVLFRGFVLFCFVL